MANEPPQASVPGGYAAVFRNVLKLCAALLIAYCIHLLMNWILGLSLFEDDRLRIGLLVVFLLAYALLIAFPFVPGVEIGLSLMMMEGSWIAPQIYISTVAGLMFAYAAGEWMPYAQLRRMLEDLRLSRACRLLSETESLTRAERMQVLRTRAPAVLRPLASRYRYLLLAVLLNLPGNAVVGGGGGIMFTAGLSRLFLPSKIALTIIIAVAPLPFAVWLFDIDLGAFTD